MLFIHFSLQCTTFHSMTTGECVQISNVAGDVNASSSQSGATAESEATSSTSSSTMADQAISNKAVPLLYEYWKVLAVIDKEIATYHDVGWLSRVLVCNSTTLDFPAIDRTNIVTFESHLMCGLRSKFVVSILTHIGCELVHLNLNAISVLSCFCMLCECWLGTPPDTSLF
jgi:hypothetical protein